MAVTRVTYITGGGGSETEEREEEVITSKFQVRLDGTLYEPAVVQKVEIEKSDDSTRRTDQCGNMKKQKAENSGWIMRVEGIITANDSRHRNLSLQLLRDVIAEQDSVYIVSDILSGEIILSNVIITQPKDITSIETRDTEGKEQAFDFQLQLGRTENEG